MSELTQIADEARRKGVRQFSGQQTGRLYPVAGFKYYPDSNKMVLRIYVEEQPYPREVTLEGVKTFDAEVRQYGSKLVESPEGKMLVSEFDVSPEAVKENSHVRFFK